MLEERHLLIKSIYFNSGLIESSKECKNILLVVTDQDLAVIESINLNNIATSKRICVLVPLAEWSSSIL